VIFFQADEIMQKIIAVLLSFILISAFSGSPARAEPDAPGGSSAEREALAIGVEAYLYFYPLVTMEITRRQATNVAPDTELGRGPMNTFANIPTFPTADFKGVVRPNFDTLYSSGWLDLTKEPMIVSVPDTKGRYYLLPMLDMWSDVFASPGWRTTGTKAGNFIVVPPAWPTDKLDKLIKEHKLHDAQRIDAPTPYVWIIGRTKTDGPDDYPAVHEIQAGFKITPLSSWGKVPRPAVSVIDPAVDMKTPPKLLVDSMAASQFFALAAELLKLQPPHVTDQPILARSRRIGFEPGKSFDIEKVDPRVRDALQSAPEKAQELMRSKLPTIGRIVNGWSLNTDTMGVYGNYYLKRAIVAQIGLGANLPQDAVYPLNLSDNIGLPLDGANNYVLHFDKGAVPPVDAFWSITLYDSHGFQVANPLGRFALSSWMPLVYEPDGALDLYIQAESPGADKETNWLPAPQGPFNLTMRLYAPHADVLLGRWAPPPVVRENGGATLPSPQ